MRTLVVALLLTGVGCSSGTSSKDMGNHDLGPPPPMSLTDFPSAPIIDKPTGGPAAPDNAASLFSAAGTATGGPCLVEPEDTSLFPQNWLRLRFRWRAAAGQNLFEIRAHSAAEKNDLVVYTAQTSWTMPAVMWQSVTSHLTDQSITVTIRGAALNGTMLTTPPALGSTVNVSIAPVLANGAIVYWTTTGMSALKGFTIGDETVHPVLIPSQVRMTTKGGSQVTCFGCHVSTPDGLAAGFTAQGPWGNVVASIVTGSVGAVPSWLGAGARQALSQADLGIETFSRGHFSAGDRVEIAPYGPGAGSQLAWFDLEATSSAQGTAYGFLARNGDSHGAGAPAWSHDGNTVAYVSTDTEFTGRLGAGAADLYTVPYNNRAGGTATPVAGASDPTLEEYYPTYSADDKLLAFDRIPDGNDMYNQPLAELYVIPPTGGTATRLKANDPPACSGATSPGVTNSWPKWSPEVATSGTRSFYWLTFSSARTERRNPQLFVTAVVIDRGTSPPTMTTHGALYLWNQPVAENNHTPAWDVFQIPVQ